MNLICQDSCLADPFFEHSVLPSRLSMKKTCAFPTSCPQKIRAPAVSRRYCVFLLPFLMERSETFLTNEYPKEYPGTNLVISSENFYEFSGLFHCSVIKVHMVSEKHHICIQILISDTLCFASHGASANIILSKLPAFVNYFLKVFLFFCILCQLTVFSLIFRLVSLSRKKMKI